MPHDPFNSRWMPLPIQARLDLLKSKKYAALIVWETLLCEALTNKTWQTSLPTSAIQKETRMSQPTILKAYQDLIEAGYISVISGGGTTRKKITFAITPIEHFTGTATTPARTLPETKPSKPIGNW